MRTIDTNEMNDVLLLMMTPQHQGHKWLRRSLTGTTLRELLKRVNPHEPSRYCEALVQHH